MFSIFLLGFAFATTPLSPAKQHCADQVIAVFENSQLNLKYDYIENLSDGRGFTAGRSGFCTATGDLLEVAREYTKLVPGNELAKYIPKLQALAKAKSPETKDLKGFEKAWQKSAKDSRFREAQDKINNKLYRDPALDIASHYGLKTNFSKIALYEALIQHGEGDENEQDCESHDGLSAMLKRVARKVGGTPATRISEEKFMLAFLEERKAVLSHACSEATRQEWSESVGRADAMIRLFQTKNYELNDPITLNPFGRPFTLQNCSDPVSPKIEVSNARK